VVLPPAIFGHVLASAWKSVRTHRRNLTGTLVIVLFCLSPTLAHARSEQDDAALENVHRRLTNTEKLTYHKPIVFVGEIIALGPVFQGVCKSAVNQSVDFMISRLLFGKFSENLVHAGFINCTSQPLPSPPFALHATVIVYCEQLRSLHCLTPVEFDQMRQKRVEEWIAAIPAGLAGQQDRGDSILWALYPRLEDHDRLAKKQGFLFEGEITRNETFHQRRCSTGSERKIEYRVNQVLWDYPDSPLRPGYLVGKDLIDCRPSPLPSWGSGTRVIVYCEALAGEGYDCLAPVMFTDDRLFRVKQWIAELKTTEGSPELLKMHYLLRDSLELAPIRPLLLLGQVTWVTPKPKIMAQTILILPTMRVSVNQLFWGYYKDAEVIAVCPHRDCSQVAVGANVIAYCQAMDIYRGPPANCPLVGLSADEGDVRRVKQWAARAREHQRALVVETIRKYLELHPADSRSSPMVYRGHATSLGKADNGLPLVHFSDTTGRFQHAIDLVINRPYGGNTPVPVEVGKPMITFCVQRDDVCYNGNEVTAIIEDSEDTFRRIERLVEAAR
jgi:hypothetical protein